MITVFAEVGYYEPWWYPAAQGAADLRRRVPARAGRAAGGAQDPRPLPASLRAQPRRPVRRAAADGRHREAALQAAVPPEGVDRLDVRAGPRDLDVHGVRDARSAPFSDTVDIFGTQVGLYGIDPSIGILYAFAFGVVIVFADVGYYEPWWIQLLKALVDLRRRLPARAGRAARRAQAARPLPAPLRAQPRRPVRRAAADGRHRQAAVQAAVPAGGLDRLDVRAGARDLDVHRGARRSRWCRSPTPSTSSAPTSGSTGSTRASACSTRSRSAGIAFYGLVLGGWASGGKYAFLGSMRAAAQLISYEIAQGLALVGVVMMAGTLSLTEIVALPGGQPVDDRAAVRRLRHLPRGRVRRDQPAAVRPPGGRRRARAGLHHRVRRRALRRVLRGRVPEHHRRLGAHDDALPRRLEHPVRRPADLGRPDRRDRQDARSSSSSSSGCARRCRACATTS